MLGKIELDLSIPQRRNVFSASCCGSEDWIAHRDTLELTKVIVRIHQFDYEDMALD